MAGPFTWSWSRYQTWAGCPRRFWLSVYQAPQAKAAGPGSPSFEVWIQRNLLGRAQWIGLAAHQAAEWYLKATVEGRPVQVEGVVGRALSQARRTIEHSSTEMYRGDPKAFRGFDAHYYEQSFDGTAALADLEAAVRKLLDHPVLARLTEVPERVREIERFSRLRLWGVDVWLSPDVVVEDGAGGFVVVDWKTGRHHQDDVVDGQLGLYALYVLDRYTNTRVDRGGPLPLDRVKGLVATLGDPPFRNRSLTPADVEATRQAILGSITAMRGEQVSAEGEVPPESAFPKVREGDPRCSWCSFRRTCQRE